MKYIYVVSEDSALHLYVRGVWFNHGLESQVETFSFTTFIWPWTDIESLPALYVGVSTSKKKSNEKKIRENSHFMVFTTFFPFVHFLAPLPL